MCPLSPSALTAIGATYVDDAGHQQSQCFLQVRLHDLSAGRDVAVVTTHLKAKEGMEEDERRVHQMRQLLRRLGSMLGPALAPAVSSNGNSANGYSSGNGTNGSCNGNGANGNGNEMGSNGQHGSDSLVPVILTGDFNATPDSAPCKVAVAMLSLLLCI